MGKKRSVAELAKAKLSQTHGRARGSILEKNKDHLEYVEICVAAIKKGHMISIDSVWKGLREDFGADYSVCVVREYIYRNHGQIRDIRGCEA